MDFKKLFDFNSPFDVNLLDHICYIVFNAPENKDFQLANAFLVEFKDHPQAWIRVDTILEHAQRPETKHYALSILDDLVKYKWNITPEEQRQGIKKYVISFMWKLANNEDNNQKIVIDRVNTVIVNIAKHEWPQKWPNFVADIIEASTSSELICENGFRILILLKEEVFEFSKDKMTSDKTRELQETLKGDFGLIFNLCEYVLTRSQKSSLIDSAIKTISCYLKLLPFEFIFQSTVIHDMLSKYLIVPEFRDSALSCLMEIGALTSVPYEATPALRKIFITSVQGYEHLFNSTQSSPKDIYGSSDDGGLFVQKLAIYFTTLFTNHLNVFECDESQKELLMAHSYLVNAFTIKDSDVFKICQEYWLFLSRGLYKEAPVYNRISSSDSPFSTQRRVFYAPILKEVRHIIIDCMAKPEEVIIVEDENGNVVREKVKDSEQLNLYRIMKDTLVYLTHLDYKETQSFMLGRLDFHLKGLMDVKVLNPLCWAIGSIAGVMPNQMEDNFLVTVIRELLTLTDIKRDTPSKAIVASNVMYIVGQYPRFLKENWTFLKAVANKLFFFMLETYEGVQDMSCDTFLKIAKSCKKSFITLQPKETVPFIEKIIEEIPKTISLLEGNQIHSFYESLGEIASAAKSLEDKTRLVDGMMDLPNQSWAEIMKAASMDVSVLSQTDKLKKISNILVTNVKVCEKLGNAFMKQLAHLYLDMLNVYRVCSESISHLIVVNGPTATRSITIKAMRTVKQKTLVLIETFVNRSTNTQPILTDFLPPLLLPVLQDYNQGIPDAKDPEVLSLMSMIIQKCNTQISKDIPIIFDNVFQCTLSMITENYEDFPDHRTQFYKLIRSVIKYCFDAMMSIPDQSFKLIMDSLFWGFKHTMRTVSEMSLLALSDLLDNVKSGKLETMFYVKYSADLLNNLLFVLTDGLHKRDLSLHARVLQKIFSAFQSGSIQELIWEKNNMSLPPGTSNVEFVRLYFLDVLLYAFPNLTQNVVDTFVAKLFANVMVPNQFKDTIRDFLVQFKEFASSGLDDNQLLYTEEMEEAEKAKREAELEALQMIPGMLQQQ